MSKPRASLVSSAILCSLSSEIVMFTWIFRGIWSLGGELPGGSAAGICLEEGPRGGAEQLLDVMDYIDAGGFGAVGLGSCDTTYGEGPRGSSRAAFLKTYALNSRGRGHILGDGVLETIENFVGGVLQTGVGLVQLAGRLRGKLAKLVTVSDVGECSKDEI